MRDPLVIKNHVYKHTYQMSWSYLMNRTLLDPRSAAKERSTLISKCEQARRSAARRSRKCRSPSHTTTLRFGWRTLTNLGPRSIFLPQELATISRIPKLFFWTFWKIQRPPALILWNFSQFGQKSNSVEISPKNRWLNHDFKIFNTSPQMLTKHREFWPLQY